MTPDEKKPTWFSLMWSNNYIQLFALAIAFLILLIVKEVYLLIPLPALMMIIIGYKGFYQYWKEYNRIQDAHNKKN